MSGEPPDPDMLPEMAALPREAAPDPALEERTVAALRGQRLLRASAGGPRWWLQAAAAVLVFAIGVAAGRVGGTASEPPDGSDQPRFLLLLYGEVDARGTGEAALVEEYRAWAMGLRREGREVSGDRLDDRRAVVPMPDATIGAGDEPRGYFFITAASLEDARAVAAASPHVRRGGRVSVRPILPS